MNLFNAGLTTKFIALFAAGIILMHGSTGLATVKSESSSVGGLGTAPLIMLDNVAVPMRDGAVLRALIALPAGSGGRWPVILTMTPYQREGGWNLAKRFARKGFVFVAIDSRGRGDSDGQFSPWINDGQDGFDAVEWAAKQPWSDGAVGMWGSSYGGANQWAAAALQPPHLKSIMPAAAGLPGFDFPMNRNIMKPYAATWAAYVSGKSGHARFFDDLDYQADANERIIRSGRAQAELDNELGLPNAIFAGFVAHPAIDDYWRDRQISPTQYASIKIPVLTITGQWDGAQSSALEHYRRHLAAAADPQHWLVVGPFDHAGTRFPQSRVGGLAIAANGVLDFFALDLAWFDWTLRGGPRPAFLEDRFRYYVMGADEWRSAASLADVAPTRLSLFLDAGKLSQGRTPPARKASYHNDPADLSRLRLGTWYRGDWLTWRKDIDQLGNAGLRYSTAPLPGDLVLAGRPEVRMSIAITTPDADFRVRLYDVAPDGSSVFLSQDAIRARYRSSSERAEFPRPGRSYPYRFDQMTFVARTIPAGHRLQLVIDTPASVFDQRNYNAGGEVARETLADARATEVVVSEGGRDAAILELPLAAPPR